MGFYFYTVRRTDPIMVRIGNAWEDAYRLEFLRRDSWRSGQYERMTRLQIGRAEHAWSKHPLKGKLVVDSHEGEVSDGFSLYRWNSESPLWHDSRRPPGTFLGIVEPYAGAWRLVPMSEGELVRHNNRKQIDAIIAGTRQFTHEGEMITGPKAAKIWEELHCRGAGGHAG